MKRKVFVVSRTKLLAALFICFVSLLPSRSHSADVFIVGDTKYKPVADVISEIRSTLKMKVTVYGTSDVKGRLGSITRSEGARLVVALGKDAVDEALKLPPDITIVFGLVIAPPKTSRPNITGVYMSTPVNEYISTVRRYLSSIKKISVVGSHDLIKVLDGTHHNHISAYRVGSSSELVNTVDRLDDSDAVLLLPDTALLTSSVMDRVYLFSYRKNIPVLGISESNVKHGSLFALVFDPSGVGRQIGEKILDALGNGNPVQIPPSPPAKFNLCLNTNTARKMGIVIPDEMIRKAYKIYP